MKKAEILADNSAEILPAPDSGNPKYAEFSQAALNILNDTSGKIYFPEKYYAGQKSLLLRVTAKLYAESPKMTVMQAVIHILQQLPDFLPADNIVKVTEIITNKWLELQKEAEIHQQELSPA